MADLISLSNELKKEADSLISETHVVDILNKLGKIDFVGSYALNLIYRPDIDIFVTSDTCSNEKAIAITKEFLDSGLFQTVGFANHTHHKAPNNLNGYYWELIVIKNDRKWKFDVWYTAEKKIVSIENVEKILDKLRKDNEARIKILELKDKLFNGTTYKNNMNGLKIYEEILGKF